MAKFIRMLFSLTTLRYVSFLNFVRPHWWCNG